MGDPAPPTVQVDQTGAPTDKGASINYLSHDRSQQTHTSTHMRRFVHYIDNGMDKAGLTKNRNGDWVFDDGYYYIPYRLLRSSVNPSDWASLTTNNRMVRVKKMGFNIVKYLPLVQRIQNVQSTTQISNQVFKDAELMILNDEARLTEELLSEEPDSDNTSVLNTPNAGMTKSFPDTLNSGKLKRAYFNMGPDFQTPGDPIAGYDSINLWNDWNVTLNSPGEKYTHSWHAGPEGNSRWYAIGAMKTRKIAGQSNLQTYPMGMLSLESDIGIIEANMATEINKNYQSNPQPMYCKVFPIHGYTSPLIIDAMIIVEYFSELEWMKRPTNSIITPNRNYQQEIPRNPWEGTDPVLQYNLNRPKNIVQWRNAYMRGEEVNDTNNAGIYIF